MIESYYQEDDIKTFILQGGLRPVESLKILEDLSKERRMLFLNFFANLLDIFIGLHIAKAIEKIFNTRVDKGAVGLVGLAASILRVLIVVDKHNNQKEIHIESDGSSTSESDVDIDGESDE